MMHVLLLNNVPSWWRIMGRCCLLVVRYSQAQNLSFLTVVKLILFFSAVPMWFKRQKKCAFVIFVRLRIFVFVRLFIVFFLTLLNFLPRQKAKNNSIVLIIRQHDKEKPRQSGFSVGTPKVWACVFRKFYSHVRISPVMSWRRCRRKDNC